MLECLKREVKYRTSRSSGPGGQHVNKTESRVELYWNLEESACVDTDQKGIIRQRLGSRLSSEGILNLASEQSRSQVQNKLDVTQRFLELISESLVSVKKRKPTKPTRASNEKRIRNKKLHGVRKQLRRDKPKE